MATDIQDMVLDSEEFSRWVFQPRYIDELGILNSKFITLRPHLKECGVSGQLINRAGFYEAVRCGNLFIRRDKNGNPIDQLVAIAKAKVSDIRSLSQDSDTIDVLSVPSESVTDHAEIRLFIKGVLFVAGENTMNAAVQDYLDQISFLLSENMIFI